MQLYSMQYENLNRKLYNCIANIYVNEQCLRKQLVPNLLHIVLLPRIGYMINLMTAREKAETCSCS